MKTSTSTAVAALSLLASSALAARTVEPLLKRATPTPSNYTDADILQYALTLEHLEATFYRQALANFTAADFIKAGYKNDTYERVVQIGQHENQHVELLTGGLTAAGAKPVQECVYKFPYTDVKGFMALSQVIEGVGVSAYEGAAQFISSADYLEIAASILTVEARHNTFVREANGIDPLPNAFDAPQSLRSVVSIAGAFFVSCPDGSAPTIQPFPALTAAPTKNGSSFEPGMMATFTPANMSTEMVSGEMFCGFTDGVMPKFTSYMNGTCMIPEDLAGQTYVVLTTSNKTISDDSILAGPAIIELSVAESSNSSNSSSSNTTSSGKPGKADTSANGSTAATGGVSAGSITRGSVGMGGAFVGLMGALAFLL